MEPADFEAERSRLTAVAARILGSNAEADDVVQEAWLRLDRTDGIDDPAAWLTTVVTRLCLDQLRRRRARASAEADLPVNPLSMNAVVSDPETDALTAESVGGAVQVVLDALTPGERVAFVLHDAFGFAFDEVGTVLGRSPAAARQLASRGRRKAQGTAEPLEELVARTDSRHVVEAFLIAARGGDLRTLVTLLAPDAVMHADLAGQQMGTQASYEGRDAVAARFDGARGALPVTIDGEPGAAWIQHRTVKVAFAFRVENGLVREVELIADPEVLATLDVVPRSTR